jgi:hypothetical protein
MLFRLGVHTLKASLFVVSGAVLLSITALPQVRLAVGLPMPLLHLSRKRLPGWKFGAVDYQRISAARQDGRFALQSVTAAYFAKITPDGKQLQVGNVKYLGYRRIRILRRTGHQVLVQLHRSRRECREPRHDGAIDCGAGLDTGRRGSRFASEPRRRLDP